MVPKTQGKSWSTGDDNRPLGQFMFAESGKGGVQSDFAAR